jgi:transposase-like protein
MSSPKEPKTLQQAIQHFANEQACIDTVAAIRWPHGPVCPACGGKAHYYLKTQKRWKCAECWRQFTVKLGTIFEDSPVPLSKWLPALWMLVNCKNGISSYELASHLGVSQKAAWFMLHRLRLALQDGSIEKAGGNGGEVECDETFVGGKLRNMHKGRKLRIERERSELRNRTGQAPFWGKVPVMGILDRETRTMRAKVVPNVLRATLQAEVLEQVHKGAKVYTDEAMAYGGLTAEQYAHQIVNHLEKYVNGRVHTNGLENFWSLLKRSLVGTYVAVEPFHLSRYVDEQVFRFNHRKDAAGFPLTPAERFAAALSQVSGKRLTFAEVTGKDGEAPF